MNSKLTKDQERELCSQLGNVRLQLLYQATVHGFTGAAFHQQCDHHGPTVSVGYNSSGYVFGGYTSKAFDQGGYTSKAFAQTGQYVQDDEAFLFTFKARNLIKYQVTDSTKALRNVATCGPYFGDTFVLVYDNQATVYSNYRCINYNFNAEEMYGNDLQLTECEVYQVEGEFSVRLYFYSYTLTM